MKLPNNNFWDYKPHLVYSPPFSKLFNSDKSKDKKDSSNYMWCLFYYCEPDEDLNPYLKYTDGEKESICKSICPSFKKKDDEINAYALSELTSIERAFKAEKEALVKRAEFLRNADYDFNTMKDLDNAFSKTSKIMEQFDKLEQQYVLSKKKEMRIFGGRQQTIREKNLIKVNEIDNED